mmetsp:Transcript_2672/g.5670  ORF Transcript_2672/g.5670 Transcript_2672/m.5670 type:complete len:260 (+) Transcript_2672:249-1028(+)|eukprot:5116946-Pleurochrysis_carterae.AAC.1
MARIVVVVLNFCTAICSTIVHRVPAFGTPFAHLAQKQPRYVAESGGDDSINLPWPMASVGMGAVPIRSSVRPRHAVPVLRGYKPKDLTWEQWEEVKRKDADAVRGKDYGAWGPRFKRTSAPFWASKTFLGWSGAIVDSGQPRQLRLASIRSSRVRPAAQEFSRRFYRAGGAIAGFVLSAVRSPKTGLKRSAGAARVARAWIVQKMERLAQLDFNSVRSWFMDVGQAALSQVQLRLANVQLLLANIRGRWASRSYLRFSR